MTPRPAGLARTTVAGLVLALLSGLLGACSALALPETGPVVEAEAPSALDARRPTDVIAVPPAPGVSELLVVKGFLDAMTASPIRVDVARQYLTAAAAAEWNPEAATITYADKLPARDVGSDIVVELSGAERLDATGAWNGRLSPQEQQVRYDVRIEDGQYRIANPRDALMVPASWFSQRFTQVSLYFFDSSARILVPEPVFVPLGDQLPTALISGLLAGPGAELGRVSRSFLPPGLKVGLSVPVSPTGVADIELLGDAGTPTPDTIERMLAQLASTLRQAPGINAVHVTIGGVEVRAPDGGADYPVDEATRFDTTGARASSRLFALQDGQLKVADGAVLQPVAGPFGVRRYALASVAVDLGATQAAGVSLDRTRVLVAPLSTSSVTGGVGAVEQVASGGTGFLPPSWDYAGRLWLVDQRAGGAVVSYVERGRVRPLRVPGVTGRLVKSFIVSRDGTRFVAVVRGEGTDQLRVSRVEVDDGGRIAGATPSVTLAADDTSQVRIDDIAWTSPTTIALLSPVLPGQLFEIRTTTVDGSPTNAEALSTTVPAPVLGLAGTPVQGRPQYAVTPNGLVDLVTGVSLTFGGAPVFGTDYVG